MEDVRRPSYYSSYPKKAYYEEDEDLNTYSVLSLVFGLVAVLFSSKIMGWASLFAGVASLTQLNLGHVDIFNVLVTLGFAIMSAISAYIKVYYDSMKKRV